MPTMVEVAEALLRKGYPVIKIREQLRTMVAARIKNSVANLSIENAIAAARNQVEKRAEK